MTTCSAIHVMHNGAELHVSSGSLDKETAISEARIILKRLGVFGAVAVIKWWGPEVPGEYRALRTEIVNG